jgi:hypothetical protein
MRSRFTEYATSSGKQTGTPYTQLSNPWNDGYIIHNVSVPPGGGILSQTNPGSITLTDCLGGSVTIPLTVKHQVLMSAGRPPATMVRRTRATARSLTRTSTDQEATLLGPSGAPARPIVDRNLPCLPLFVAAASRCPHC